MTWLTLEFYCDCFTLLSSSSSTECRIALLRPPLLVVVFCSSNGVCPACTPRRHWSHLFVTGGGGEKSAMVLPSLHSDQQQEKKLQLQLEGERKKENGWQEQQGERERERKEGASISLLFSSSPPLCQLDLDFLQPLLLLLLLLGGEEKGEGSRKGRGGKKPASCSPCQFPHYLLLPLNKKRREISSHFSALQLLYLL